VIANARNIGERDFFEIEDPTDRAVPTVSFGTPSTSGA
jgi:hypothetical protein